MIESKHVDTLWRGYRLLEALSDLAIRHLSHHELPEAREAVDSISRALAAELGDEEQVLDRVKRAGASEHVLAEMHQQAQHLRDLGAEAVKFAGGADRKATIEALRRLRQQLRNHQEEAALVVYPMVSD